MGAAPCCSEARPLGYCSLSKSLATAADVGPASASCSRLNTPLLRPVGYLVVLGQIDPPAILRTFRLRSSAIVCACLMQFRGIENIRGPEDRQGSPVRQARVDLLFDLFRPHSQQVSGCSLTPLWWRPDG